MLPSWWREGEEVEVPTSTLLGSLEASCDYAAQHGEWSYTTAAASAFEITDFVRFMREWKWYPEGTLADKLASEGQKDPVCVYQPKETGLLTLGNGHHRVAFAMFRPLPTVRVYCAPDDDYMSSERTEAHRHDE